MAGPDPVVGLALAIIADRARCRPLDRATIAAHVGVSSSTLAHRLKKLTGSSTAEHINRARVNSAKQLLHKTDLPIKAIAVDVGFRRSSDLSYWFRRLQGITPSAFRRVAP